MTRHSDASNVSQAGLWLSISEIARRRGLHRDSVRERVDRLVAKGLISTRTEGRSRMVDLAAFDRAVGQVGDAFKEAAAETKREQPAASKPLRDAQTDKAIYEARLKALDLAERQGQILPIKGEHGIENALAEAAVAVAREFDRLPLIADDLAVAISKEGVTGVRRVLKEFARKGRNRSAEAMTKIFDKGRAAEAEGVISTDID